VLTKGDPVAAPSGRADDFAWPRRDVAAVGTDPVAATTTFPMTPMVAERPVQSSTSAALGSEGAPAGGARAQLGPGGPKSAENSTRQRTEPRRRENPFFFLFPGR
jgi:uncharacterized protein